MHGWDYRFDTGVSAYKNDEVLEEFTSWIEDGGVYIDGDEVAAFETEHPQPYDRNSYQGAYHDFHGTRQSPMSASSESSRPMGSASLVITAR